MTINEHFTSEPPALLGRAVQRLSRFTFEQVHVGQEVMRTLSALQARDQLQENAVQSIAQRALVAPFVFVGMLFTFVENETFENVVGNRHRIEITVA